jgi:hypothetical protein
MSETPKDEAEQKANAILRCNCGLAWHLSSCPASYRLAVAAVLREAHGENDRLKRVITAIMGRCANLLDDDQFNNLEAMVDVEPTFDAITNDLRAEIAKAERDKYEKDAIFHRVKVEDLKDEVDAAYVRGLERARVIADEIELMTVDYGIEGAIQAEIDKAKK